MSDLTVANTILAQLGGGKFIAMTGSKNFGGTADSLAFKVGRNAGRVSYVIIKLNGLDLYDVEYIRVRKAVRTTLATSEDLFGDMLQADFTAKTGLYTSLGTCGRVTA